jgi:type VI secretion system protein ImpF
MPDPRSPEDQLQPALLDRLTDDEPEQRLEPRARRVITKRQLRQAVLRDLAWLLNSTRLDAHMDATMFPLARRSVINYGLPALSGETATTIEIADLERGIRQAILDYEPRILPSTLRVRALQIGEFDNHNIIGIEISGQLWAQPIPLDLLVRTEIDLETGTVKIAEVAEMRASS